MTKPISLNGISLEPAPFVNTSYEYNRSGSYVIGGFLLVTLTGKLVGTDLISQIQSISNLQANDDCVDLTIGCDGGTDFLSGQGKVRSVDITDSDQPFISDYSIVVAIEKINGNDAVEPDEEFLSYTCLSKEDFKNIISYSEEISIEGEGSIISSSDGGGFGVTKSFIKGSGKISITADSSFNNCDETTTDDIVSKLVKTIEKRASSLMNFDSCNSGDNPLSAYAGYTKYLDSKKLDINSAGSVTWSFDVYLGSGSCNILAWVDITTEDILDQSKPSQVPNRKVSGTIRGVSTMAGPLLNNKATSSDRLSNANQAFNAISSLITNNQWPSPGSPGLSGFEGDCILNTCPPSTAKQPCLQRINSQVSKSVVSGEISFSAEFGPINDINQNIDITVEEELPAVRYVEFIIPNNINSILQRIGDTPHKATITARGSVPDCDPKKRNQLVQCLKAKFEETTSEYQSWLLLDRKETNGVFSYSVSETYIKCDS